MGRNGVLVASFRNILCIIRILNYLGLKSSMYRIPHFSYENFTLNWIPLIGGGRRGGNLHRRRLCPRPAAV